MYFQVFHYTYFSYMWQEIFLDEKSSLFHQNLTTHSGVLHILARQSRVSSVK
jgi:hypothetical protein